MKRVNPVFRYSSILTALFVFFVGMPAQDSIWQKSAYATHSKNTSCPGGSCVQGCLSWWTFRYSNCCTGGSGCPNGYRCCGTNPGSHCCWIPPPPYCGDKSCNNGETCSSCQGDCGKCPPPPPPPAPQCGKNGCESGENCSNCPQDCGSCDTTPPVFSGISNQSLYVDSFCQPINYSKPASISASDNKDGSLSYSASSGARLYWSVPNLPMNFPLGITNINWYARDSFGNQSTVLQKWTLIDNIKPLLSNVSNSYTIQANEIPTNYTGTTFIISANASDNCDTTPSVTINPNTTKFAVGNYSLTVSACDDSSNCQTQIVSLTIEDTLGPNVNFFGNRTIEQSFLSGASVSITPTIQDNSDKNPVYEVHYNTATGTRLSSFESLGVKTDNFNLGQHQLYWISRDTYNNINTQLQTIVIQDTTKPIVSGWISSKTYQANYPQPYGSITSQNELNDKLSLILSEATDTAKTQILSSANPIIIPYPNASDTCDANLTISNNAPNSYQVGLTRVIYNIVDDTGNTAIVNHDVMVIDTTKPVFLEADDNKKLPTLTYVPDESYDPLNTNACFIPSIPIPNLYDNGYAVKDLIVNMKNTPNCYNPPAPSDTTKDANIYTITWEVIDPIGNKETATQDIRVKRQYIIISTGFENDLGAFIPDGYTNQPVTLNIEISAANGINESISGNRVITITPAPDEQNKLSAYSEEAIYFNDRIIDGITISIHDTGVLSNEDNWGYKHVRVTFGIDTTKPKIEFELEDDTYYYGEDLLISNVIFSDKQGSVVSGIESYEVSTTANSITHNLVNETEELYGKPKGGKERVTNIACSENDISSLLCSDDSRFIFKPDYNNGEQNVTIFKYGQLGDIPLFGKWSTNIPSNVGVYRPKEKKFYLLIKQDPFTELILNYGEYGDQPLVGDFDGNGVDTLGVYRSGEFLLRNSNSDGTPDIIFKYGNARDTAFSGNFNNDTIESVGVYRNNTFYLKNSLDDSPADKIVSLGLESEEPIIHDQNNDSVSSAGIKVFDTIYLRNSQTNGIPEESFNIVKPHDIIMIQKNDNFGKSLPIIFRSEGFIDVKALSLLENNFRGEHQLNISVTDAAQNTEKRVYAVIILNYHDALEKILSKINQRFLDNDLRYDESASLESAKKHFIVAKNYQEFGYDGGSYLRSEQGIKILWNIYGSTDYQKMTKDISRALKGDVVVLHRGLAEMIQTNEEMLYSQSKNILDESKNLIENDQVLMAMQKVRKSYDTLALLSPLFDSILLKKEMAENSSGNIGKITNLISSIPQLLDLAINDEITQVLAEGSAVLKNELFQVQQELGAVKTNCLFNLQGFQLDDYSFIQCYLSINLVAEYLDIVAESLVYSYYWKTALSLSLFSMLDISLNLSPTSLKAIANQHGYLDPLNVNYDSELSGAFDKYIQAYDLLMNGNIHEAMDIYLSSKCVMISVYNKYYSKRRTLPNIADPPDPILLPIDYGCN